MNFQTKSEISFTNSALDMVTNTPQLNLKQLIYPVSLNEMNIMHFFF